MAALLSLRTLRRAWYVLQNDGAQGLMSRARHRARRQLYLRKGRPPYLQAPPIDRELLGMTTPEEQAYLRWYAGNEYTGKGEIVDLGCWLGSSTIPMALGLADNAAVADKKKRIHAYDRFLWDVWMEATVVGSELAERYAPGESFLDEYHKRTAQWSEFIEVMPGDLNELGWNRDLPIEFLFNDASKGPDLAVAILRNFYPHLVPGRSLVVEQDFAHFYTSWVHILRYRLRDWFEPVLHVPFSGSSVFRMIRPVPTEFLERDHGMESYREEEIEAAFRWSAALATEEMRPNVFAAQAMLHVHRGDPERAARELDRIHREGYRDMDLLVVRKEVDRALAERRN